MHAKFIYAITKTRKECFNIFITFFLLLMLLLLFIREQHFFNNKNQTWLPFLLLNFQTTHKLTISFKLRFFLLLLLGWSLSPTDGSMKIFDSKQYQWCRELRMEGSFLNPQTYRHHWKLCSNIEWEQNRKKGIFFYR